MTLLISLSASGANPRNGTINAMWSLRDPTLNRGVPPSSLTIRSRAEALTLRCELATASSSRKTSCAGGRGAEVEISCAARMQRSIVKGLASA